MSWIPLDGWNVQSSFISPVPAPTPEPGDAPLECVSLNPAWWDVLRGALTQLNQPGAWRVDHSTFLNTVLPQVTALQERFGDPQPCAYLGEQFWVVMSGNDTVLRLKPDFTAVGPPLVLDGGANGTGIAVVGTEVWVVQTGLDNIARFDLLGNRLGTYATSATAPAYACTSAGLFWLVDTGHKKVLRYHFNGVFKDAIGPAGVFLGTPRGICLDGATVFVSDDNASAGQPVVCSLDATTGANNGDQLTCIGTYSDVRGIEATAGSTYVANHDLNTVVRQLQAHFHGCSATFSQGSFSGIGGILYAAPNLWVTSEAGNSATIIDLSNTVVATLSGFGWSGPRGVAHFGGGIISRP